MMFKITVGLALLNCFSLLYYIFYTPSCTERRLSDWLGAQCSLPRAFSACTERRALDDAILVVALLQTSEPQNSLPTRPPLFDSATQVNPDSKHICQALPPNGGS